METTINTSNQEVAQSNNNTPKYIVSDNTAMFLDLLKQQDVLFKDIYKAIEKFYGVSNVDRLMDDFYPILCTLKDKVFEYVKDSMNCNTGSTI